MTSDNLSSMQPEQAYSALESYAERYGRLPLLLLAHTAVPQNFRADLLNLIKINFMPEASDDLTVDADVLFSPFVESHGAGFYRLDSEVRHQCLILLDAAYMNGLERRRVSVARFMLAYLNDVERRPQLSGDPLLAEYVYIERQLAAAIVDPSAAAARLARALADPPQAMTVARGHLTHMATALSVPLAGYRDLLTYAGAIGALQSGNELDAERLLKRLSSENIKVEGITLPLASELLADSKKKLFPGSEVVEQRVDAPAKPGAALSSKAYLPDFKYDGYVSYARIDDNEIGPEPIGWVTGLCKDLQMILSQLLGKEVNLWLNQHEIRSHEDFREKIQEPLERTKIFIAIVSPAYLHREWTNRELQIFTENAERHAGLTTNDTHLSRIFKVEKAPVDLDMLPLPMRGQKVYKFNSGKPAREFRPHLDTEFGKHYYAGLTDLAYDIKAVLREMDGDSSSNGATDSHRGRLAVYVAETTSSLRNKVDWLRRELRESGYLVLPDKDFSRHAGKYTEQVRDYLKRAVLSIHVIGDEWGFAPEGDTRSILQIQHDLAVERSVNSQFQRLIWFPTEVRPLDPRQIEFIVHLQDDVSAQTGVDLLNGRMEDLRTVVLEKLVDIAENEKQKVGPVETAQSNDKVEKADGSATSATDDVKRIYIMCEKNDRNSPSFKALCRYLFDQGYEPILPIDGAIEKHVDRLKDSDAFLIYYGSGSPDWYQFKLDDLRRHEKSRVKPILAKAIYIAPSPDGNNDDKDMVITREAQILRGSETFSPEIIEPFMQKLRSG